MRLIHDHFQNHRRYNLDTDDDFRIEEFMHFTSRMLKREPKETGTAGCMIVFCGWDQQPVLVEEGRKYGYAHTIPLVFRKNYSPQVLKANQRVVGNAEYGLILYRNKLPKFRNQGRMIFNILDWPRDNTTPKIHPTQKPRALIEFLIETFTDPDDVVIDPCAGSGITLLAAENLGREAYGFEIKHEYVRGFNTNLAPLVQPRLPLEAGVA